MRRWSWCDLPALKNAARSAGGAHAPATFVGMDPRSLHLTHLVERYFDDRFGPSRMRVTAGLVGFDTGAFENASIGEAVRALKIWLDERIEHVPDDWCALREPQDPMVTARDGGASTDLCALASGLLAELGVESYPVVVHCRDSEFPGPHVLNPNLFNYKVLWLPGLDPEGKLLAGFVDVADPAQPADALSERIAGSPAYLLSDVRKEWCTLPQGQTNGSSE